jgi:hypothetical protein
MIKVYIEGSEIQGMVLEGTDEGTDKKEDSRIVKESQDAGDN